ncbi:unnamed protein product [Brachionus calyciflorus]|uniref:Uncharacterized protein n=1 Tax=Brachionus calyciflorus TaxID=104777 RepID=A0A813TC64_9BILA|nr:unnamed protein product [Brachionus calyciflorus]
MKKLLLLHIVTSLLGSLFSSTIPVLDLSIVTPIINHTNVTGHDNETIPEAEPEKPFIFIPSHFNDQELFHNQTQLETTIDVINELNNNETNENSTIISNYVEVYVFNNESMQNSTQYPEHFTKYNNETILLTPYESFNSTNDNIAAFNITIYENSFGFSSSIKNQFNWFTQFTILMAVFMLLKVQ